jgi:hypothetical protein
MELWFCRESLASHAMTRFLATAFKITHISPVRQPGMYVLQTDTRKSAAFEIGSDVYRHALGLTMREYYGQRCGCDVDLGGGYSPPVCQPEPRASPHLWKERALQEPWRLVRCRRLWPIHREFRSIEWNASVGYPTAKSSCC